MAIFDLAKYYRENQGYKFILCIVHVYSRKIWAYKMKHKDTRNVFASFKQFIRDWNIEQCSVAIIRPADWCWMVIIRPADWCSVAIIRAADWCWVVIIRAADWCRIVIIRAADRCSGVIIRAADWCSVAIIRAADWCWVVIIRAADWFWAVIIRAAVWCKMKNKDTINVCAGRVGPAYSAGFRAAMPPRVPACSTPLLSGIGRSAASPAPIKVIYLITCKDRAA